MVEPLALKPSSCCDRVYDSEPLSPLSIRPDHGRGEGFDVSSAERLGWGLASLRLSKRVIKVLWGRGFQVEFATTLFYV
jgi:hypothetical protein